MEDIMTWDPLDTGSYSDPRRYTYLLSEQIRDEKSQKRSQRAESARAVAVSGIPMVLAAIVLNGSSELRAYWAGQPMWADAIRIAVALACVASLIWLSRMGLRRYAASEEFPAVPLWFRAALALLELGYLAALDVACLILIVGVGERGIALEIGLYLLAAAFVLMIGGALLRWWGKPYGWETGRLFWGRYA